MAKESKIILGLLIGFIVVSVLWVCFINKYVL